MAQPDVASNATHSASFGQQIQAMLVGNGAPPSHFEQALDSGDVSFYISLAFDKGVNALHDQQKSMENSVGELRLHLQRLESQWYRLEHRVVGSLDQQQELLKQHLQNSEIPRRVIHEIVETPRQSPTGSSNGHDLGPKVGTPLECSLALSGKLEQDYAKTLDQLEQESQHHSKLLDEILQKCSTSLTPTMNGSAQCNAEMVLASDDDSEEGVSPRTPGSAIKNELRRSTSGMSKEITRSLDVNDSSSTAFDFHIKTLEKLKKVGLQGSHCRDCLGMFGHVPSSSPSKLRASVFVNGPVFGAVCACATLLFAVFAGVEANSSMQFALLKEPEPQWTSVGVNIFNAWFAFEVIVRLSADGCRFFYSDDCRWNVFDLVLVIFSLTFLAADGFAISFFRMLRGFKVVKALRIVRIFHIFVELRLLVASILTSLASLLWSLVFLLIITYLCSIVFIQGAVAYLKQDKETQSDDLIEALHKYFDSLPQAVYFLTACITGGVDWVDVAVPLWQLGYFYGLFFVSFVLISILGILNVVTGVFVEHASNIPRIDRDFAILQHIAGMRLDIVETMQLFSQMDVEQQGIIHMDALMTFMTEERIIAHFATLQIDVTDRNRLGMMFDADEDNCVSMEEFVVGCVRLRGGSQKSDAVAMMIEMKRLATSIENLDVDVGAMMQAKREKAKRQVSAHAVVVDKGTQEI